MAFEPESAQNFRLAIAKFSEDVPQISKVLKGMINTQTTDQPNSAFIQKRREFLDLCKMSINSKIEYDSIDEMIIQHILTEEIFKTVFSDTQFHEENNIAKILTALEKTFFIGQTKRQTLASIQPYYEAIKAHSTALHTHEQKQDFLKIVYENFYQAYNPKSADKLGIVYTPSEIVHFMIESVDYLLEQNFERNLGDKGVDILDPATGTGTFITDLIKYLPPQSLFYKYKNEIHANEISILPYYIANLNIEYIYNQRMKTYETFDNLCWVDTLDNLAGMENGWRGKNSDYQSTGDLFAISAENAKRIKAQNDKKISVIIGNPPYNANQQNENDNNKNREYPQIDARIKKTFIDAST
ncbi:MAG: DNA methyltransferase, partial [Bacteroidetes bacterium]